eukprot:4675036-Amphidinium_carterae.1
MTIITTRTVHCCSLGIFLEVPVHFESESSSDFVPSPGPYLSGLETRPNFPPLPLGFVCAANLVQHQTKVIA